MSKYANQTKAKLPATFSTLRPSTMGDAIFTEPNGNPVPVIEHGLRGTQNQFSKKTEMEVSNIQTTHTARLSSDNKILIASFDIRTFSLANAVTNLYSKDKAVAEKFNQYLQKVISEGNENGNLKENARRMAVNILNGRWLFRNRMGAESIQVEVTIGSKTYTQDAFEYPLNDISWTNEAVEAVANALALGWAGKGSSTIEVKAIVDMGVKGAEVYPSQNYLTDKPSGFARSLYYVSNSDIDAQILVEQENLRSYDGKATRILTIGQAAETARKVWNAIRTIDTSYEENAKTPIPVEPLGANLDANKHYRPYKQGNGNSFFDFMAHLDHLDQEDASFVLAVLLRGGVFSVGEEEKPKKSKDGEEVVVATEEAGV